MHTKISNLHFLSTLVFIGLMVTNSSVKSQNRTDFSGVQGTVTDIDGNLYHTIKIGKQLWMAENLRTTRFNDSMPIPFITDNEQWSKLNSPGYCWYNNKPGTYKNEYGALYNYYSVSSGKLAPKGWHIPTDEDWQTLIDTLGGESIAGGKIKERSTLHWENPNIVTKDSCGFSALPGGCRFSSGQFFLLKKQGYWWMLRKEIKKNFAVSRSVVSFNTTAHKFDEIKTYGLSVRCIKDE
jgi:uncharacterized protein (TIGR02145 family)